MKRIVAGGIHFTVCGAGDVINLLKEILIFYLLAIVLITGVVPR